MKTQTTPDIFKDSKICQSAKVLFFYLNSNNPCTKSNKQLSCDLRLTCRQISTLVNQLKNRGYIDSSIYKESGNSRIISIKKAL